VCPGSSSALDSPKKSLGWRVKWSEWVEGAGWTPARLAVWIDGSRSPRVGLAGAAGMLVSHGWSLSVVACAGGALALAGAVAGWALAQGAGAGEGGASRRATAAGADGGDLGSLEADALMLAAGTSPEFWRKVILVWSRQITSAKAQMEAAVQELTTRFLGIVEKLDLALGASNPAGQGRESSPGQAAAGSGAPGSDGAEGLGAVFSRSEAELGNVTASLKASTTS
jgi:methyl-accepting chemotaxis protein